MREQEHPIIGGLRLGWHTFAAPRPDEEPTDQEEVAFGLWVPDDPDITLDQITQEEFDRSNERMPYFATIWPSAESLVAEVLAGPAVDGRHALDLGCGLGPCGFAAARRCARVTFFDWEPRALEIVKASAAEQQTPAAAFDFVVGDWRDPPPFDPFDIILGADVLYERRNLLAVAGFLARHLKPGAEAWITDPGRPQAQQFPDLAKDEGLDLLDTRLLPPLAANVQITLWRLRQPR